MISPQAEPAVAVLDGIVAARRAQDEASVSIFVGAAAWADLHPGLDPEWVTATPRETDLPAEQRRGAAGRRPLSG